MISISSTVALFEKSKQLEIYPSESPQKLCSLHIVDLLVKPCHHFAKFQWFTRPTTERVLLPSDHSTIASAPKGVYLLNLSANLIRYLKHCRGRDIVIVALITYLGRRSYCVAQQHWRRRSRSVSCVTVSGLGDWPCSRSRRMGQFASRSQALPDLLKLLDRIKNAARPFRRF